MQTLFLALAISGISLLWRTYRYDPDNSFNAVLNRLPYVLRKPITCGLCFTFWISLITTIMCTPFADLSIAVPFRFLLGMLAPVAIFLAQWFALGTIATAVVYVIDTFYQVSHYYKHKATSSHQ